MKETDLNVIRTHAIDVIENVGCSLDEYIDQDEVADCITMIYANNDMILATIIPPPVPIT